MNELQKVFEYQGAQVRTVVNNGEPWFVAKDICDVLEIGNPTMALMRLNNQMKGVSTIETLGGNQQANIVSEAGVYKLVFTSRKPEAEKFTDWLAEEVLPTIRKTGGYVANEDMFIATYLPSADEGTKALFKATLETLRRQNEKLAIMAPKADYFDSLVDRNLLTNFRDTAKELKIKESAFIDWLMAKKYIYRDQSGKLKPYAGYVPSLFEIKEWERNNKTGTQTLITPRGRETFRLLLGKAEQSA